MKRLSYRFAVLGLTAIAMILSGCEAPEPAQDAPPPQVGLSDAELQEAADELFETDLAFAAAVNDVGVAEAYRRFLAEDAVHLPDGGLAVGGRDSIYEELREVTEGLEFELTWEPLEAQVAASGDLGFTWGIYYFESVDELGAPYVAEGKYVFVWSYNGGRWELLLDMSNQTEPYYEEAYPEDPLLEGSAAAE